MTARPPVFVQMDEMSDEAIGLLRILAKHGFQHHVVLKGGGKGYILYGN